MKKEIFSGIGLGLLVGVIIGLSIAEVTGIILGALTSILAAFFGLRSTKEGESGKQLTIGVFGFACVISIFLGLFIRTHNLLAPSMASQVKSYREAAFDSAEIKKIIMLKEFGVIPDGVNFSKEAKLVSQSSILMAGENEIAYLCSGINDTSSLEDIQDAFKRSGAQYADLEQQLTGVIANKTDLRNTLLFFKNLVCNKP